MCFCWNKCYQRLHLSWLHSFITLFTKSLPMHQTARKHLNRIEATVNETKQTTVYFTLPHYSKARSKALIHLFWLKANGFIQLVRQASKTKFIIKFLNNDTKKPFWLFFVDTDNDNHIFCNVSLRCAIASKTWLSKTSKWFFIDEYITLKASIPYFDGTDSCKRKPSLSGNW